MRGDEVTGALCSWPAHPWEPRPPASSPGAWGWEALTAWLCGGRGLLQRAALVVHAAVLQLAEQVEEALLVHGGRPGDALCTGPRGLSAAVPRPAPPGPGTGGCAPASHISEAPRLPPTASPPPRLCYHRGTHHASVIVRRHAAGPPCQTRPALASAQKALPWSSGPPTPRKPLAWGWHPALHMCQCLPACGRVPRHTTKAREEGPLPVGWGCEAPAPPCAPAEGSGSSGPAQPEPVPRGSSPAGSPGMVWPGCLSGQPFPMSLCPHRGPPSSSNSPAHPWATAPGAPSGQQALSAHPGQG